MTVKSHEIPIVDGEITIFDWLNPVASTLETEEKILEQLTPTRARYRVFARDAAAKETEKFYGATWHPA